MMEIYCLDLPKCHFCSALISRSHLIYSKWMLFCMFSMSDFHSGQSMSVAVDSEMHFRFQLVN